MSSNRSIQIAITVDPEIPVPPTHYGGIERIVDMLVRGLIDRGHDVTLFAHPDSNVPCKLEPYPGRKSRSKADLLKNMRHVSLKVFKEGYDIVHSFGRLAYLLPVLPLQIPKLMSYQRLISARSIEWGQIIARGTLHFTGCSGRLIRSYTENDNWNVVYNGVPIKAYSFNSEVRDGAPLVYLGRIEEIKGVHLAIKVASLSKRKLIIAGNVPNEPKHKLYFQSKIAPHIDGKKIQYMGPVSDDQKNELLGNAAALLMPILWDEPFGIVMSEALACGTPVIGLNRGSVPEVVQNGINGFVCESVDEMVEAVNYIKNINRTLCRQIMERKFSDIAIVNEYEKLYMKLADNKTSPY